MQGITRDNVVATWYMRGLESYLAAFSIPSFMPRFRFKSFLYIVGLELITKSYLLAKNAEEYDDLEVVEGKIKVNRMMKKRGHYLIEMAEVIREDSGDREFASLLDSKFMASSDNGLGLLKVMEAGYRECRYPVPKEISEDYPVEGVENARWLPLESTDIQNFAFVYAREILRLLKEKYKIQIPVQRYHSIIQGDLGMRFSGLFLTGRTWSYFGKIDDANDQFGKMFSSSPAELTDKS